MIAKITRGWRPGGLLRYLLGEGRFNEHRRPHVMASWDGAPELHQVPVALYPDGQVASVDEAALAVLAGDLSDAAVAAGVELRAPDRQAGRKVPRGPVWHCSLRNHAEDRPLSDEEWAEVVEDLMHHTEIALRGDLGACRWVAVRHAEDHVHVMAVLVRQDNGRRVHPRNDYFRARETCLAAEERLGLRSTAAADRTAVEQPTRAELEKAVRREVGETSREWLRRAARVAAVQARDPEAFFSKLGDLGVLCRAREFPPGQLRGYVVADPDDLDAQGEPIWFGGRALARDLSLPALLRRWASAPPPPSPVPPRPGERASVGREERGEALHDAAEACREAAAELRGTTDSESDEQRTADSEPTRGVGDGAAPPTGRRAAAEERVGPRRARRAPEDVPVADPDIAAEIGHAAGDLLTAVGALSHPGRPGERWEPAELFERATRQPGVGQPGAARGDRDAVEDGRWHPVAARLRSAAWRLIAVRTLTARDSAGYTELLVALAALLAELAAWHEQNRQLAHAAAARDAGAALRSGRAAGPRTPLPHVRGRARRSVAGTGVAPLAGGTASSPARPGSREAPELGGAGPAR